MIARLTRGWTRRSQSCPPTVPARWPPSAQGSSPARGVTPDRATSRVASEGVTPPSSLLRAHAPDQNPPRASESSLCTRSLQVAVSPCWEMALPDVISRPLRRCSDPYPAARSSAAFVRCFTEHTGLTPRETGSTPQDPHTATSVGSRISRLQSFDYLRAPTLARPPGCSDRDAQRRRAPGLSHHAEPGRLPDPGSGVASCPTRTTDTAGLSPAGSQPCRLLPPAHGLPTSFTAGIRLLPPVLKRPGSNNDS